MLSSMSVSIGTSKTKFSASVDKTGRIYVEGCVRGGVAYISKIGAFDVELRYGAHLSADFLLDAACYSWPRLSCCSCRRSLMSPPAAALKRSSARGHMLKRSHTLEKGPVLK